MVKELIIKCSIYCIECLEVAASIKLVGSFVCVLAGKRERELIDIAAPSDLAGSVLVKSFIAVKAKM